MSLLKERNHYKPFQYPWAFEAYDQQQKMHWLPSEVPLAEDVRDWNERLNEKEKNLITQILKFFTQGDVDIAQAYLDNYIPKFKPPEIRMMLSSIATSEANHAHSYSLLNDTIGLPDSEYHAFLEYKEMADKLSFMQKSDNTTQRGLAHALAKSVFNEGVALFASFVMLLNFQRFGKMKGMGKVVEWSIRDESMHVEGNSNLFKSFCAEHPKLVDDEFKKEIYLMAREIVKLEDKFIDLAYSLGDIEGLSADDVKKYIRYITDRRLLQLGLKTTFKVKENPLSWLEWVLNGADHTNFFENRVTEYEVAGLSGTWESAYTQ